MQKTKVSNMSEKNSILNLCVCMALSDHSLDKNETSEILNIAKELKENFNVHDAHDEINKKFLGDTDLAQDFYLNLIQVDKNKKLAKEFVKRVAIANGELKDKEVRFLVRMKHAWGYEHFD